MEEYSCVVFFTYTAVKMVENNRLRKTMTKWAKVQGCGSIDWLNSEWKLWYNTAKADWQVLQPRPSQMHSQFTPIYFISIIYFASMMKKEKGFSICALVWSLIYYGDHLRDLRQKKCYSFLHFRMGKIQRWNIKSVCESPQLQLLNRIQEKQFSIWHYSAWSSIAETLVTSDQFLSAQLKANSWIPGIFSGLRKVLQHFSNIKNKTLRILKYICST